MVRPRQAGSGPSASKLRGMPTTSKRAPAGRRSAGGSSRARKPARSKAKPRRRRSRGGLLGRGLGLPVLEQRQRDALGFGWLLGRARVFAPVTLVLGGGVLLLRPVLPAVRPMRTGLLCLFAGVTLALAAGTLGLSSGPGAHGAAWSSAHL